jgi:hypothetical protein
MIDLQVKNCSYGYYDSTKAMADVEYNTIYIGCDMGDAKREFKELATRSRLKRRNKKYHSPEEYYEGEIEILLTHETLHLTICSVVDFRTTFLFDNIDFNYEISDVNLL